MEEGALVSVVRLRRATAEEPFDEEVLTTELQIIEDEANNAAKQSQYQNIAFKTQIKYITLHFNPWG